MAVDLREYRFRGARAEGSGRTLEDAIDRLADFWDSRPSLVPHAWGVLKLSITIEGTEAIFEVTDAKILDQLEAGNTGSLVQWMAEKMGLGVEDVSDLLDQSSEVIAAVDRIRPPDNQEWNAEFGFDGNDVLPEAALSWVTELGRQADVQIQREGGKAKSPQAKRMMDAVLSASMERGLDDKQISAATGLPRSTVRDARLRVERQSKIVEGFSNHQPGQRYSEAQTQEILTRLEANDGNAAQTGRDLGISPRTIRDIRKRASSAASVKRTKSQTQKKPRQKKSAVSSSSTYSSATHDKVLDLVRGGASAAEAGRKAGVSPRTAQRWVAAEKEK